MAKTARVVTEPVETESRTADILELEDVAARRERFLAHAEASSRVAAYWLQIPEGATVASLADPAVQRDAADQLHLVTAMIGGSLGRTPGGVVVRVPLSAHERFEALARPILDAWLVAFHREAC
ncbi:MAG: hypothetical protein J7515_06365 [Caulobacter sp.]|nr:hypothetical protein [Caulobacter sp.]